MGLGYGFRYNHCNQTTSWDGYVPATRSVPICVDLDGSLIRTDLLVETFLLLLKKQPWVIFIWPFWLLRGKAYFKQTLAERISFDASQLPYQPELLSWLKEQRQQGRILVLATASHQLLAQKVADHLGIFAEVMATHAGINLSGKTKAQRLTQRYGIRGYDYVGNHSCDLEVWKMANKAIVVHTSSRLELEAARECTVEKVFYNPAAKFSDYTKALRLHQWLKNVLIFIPMLMAHKLMQPNIWLQSLTAFVTFSWCASSVYLMNDLLDLPSDRKHPRKKNRPFAAGIIPAYQGFILVPVLLLLSISLALYALPLYFTAVLGAYYMLTMAYSVWLKSIVMMDILVLASLYTLRILAGMAATGIALSFWLLAFSLFIFFSLALVKRYSELYLQCQLHELTDFGRGYHVKDMIMLMIFGVTSGFMAVLIFALYLNSPDLTHLYPHAERLWLITPILLYWVSRIWVITHRGEMHDDPVVFAATDTWSWVMAFMIMVMMYMAA